MEKLRFYSSSAFILGSTVIGIYGLWSTSEGVMQDVISGVVMIVLAIATTNFHGNIISGLSVVINVGSKIQVDGHVGRVSRLRLTGLELLKDGGQIVRIPYSNYAASTVVDFSQHGYLEVTIPIHIYDYAEYDHSTPQTETCLVEFVDYIRSYASSQLHTVYSGHAFPKSPNYEYPFVDMTRIAEDSDVFSIVLLKPDTMSQRLLTSKLLVRVVAHLRSIGVGVGQEGDIAVTAFPGVEDED